MPGLAVVPAAVAWPGPAPRAAAPARFGPGSVPGFAPRLRGCCSEHMWCTGDEGRWKLPGWQPLGTPGLCSAWPSASAQLWMAPGACSAAGEAAGCSFDKQLLSPLPTDFAGVASRFIGELEWQSCFLSHAEMLRRFNGGVFVQCEMVTCSL